MKNPFRYFNSSPEVIRLAVMTYIRYPLDIPGCRVLACPQNPGQVVLQPLGHRPTPSVKPGAVHSVCLFEPLQTQPGSLSPSPPKDVGGDAVGDAGC